MVWTTNVGDMGQPRRLGMPHGLRSRRFVAMACPPNPGIAYVCGDYPAVGSGLWARDGGTCDDFLCLFAPCNVFAVVQPVDKMHSLESVRAAIATSLRCEASFDVVRFGKVTWRSRLVISRHRNEDTAHGRAKNDKVLALGDSCGYRLPYWDFLRE